MRLLLHKPPLGPTISGVSESSNYAWIFGGLLAVAGVGILRTLKPGCVSPIVPGGRVLLVGDSLGVGMDRYFATLAKEAGMDYASNVQGSTTTAFWAKDQGPVAASVASFNPTLTLISLGTNDTKTNYTLEQLDGHIRHLISIVSTRGGVPVWILQPSLPFADRGFTQLVRDTGIRVFESSRIDIPRGPDGIHATGLGYAGWAGAVWQDLSCGKLPAPAPAAGLGAVRTGGGRMMVRRKRRIGE